MKQIFCALSIFLLTGTVSLHAQEKTSPAPGFASFWTKFNAAVVKDDKEAVAALTNFPFNYQGQMDKAGFLKAYPKIFDAKTKACFAKAKPVGDAVGYSVFCGETLYFFTPMVGDFRFTDIGAND